MSSAASGLYEFGTYRFDVGRRLFMREGHNVPMAPKTFELLLLLVQQPGRAFSKHELMTALWPDTFVEEANLSFQISVLRKALGEDAGLIETVPKYGYRFAADVKTVPDPTPSPDQVEPADPAVIVRRSRRAAVSIGAAVLLFAGGAAWITFGRHDDAPRPGAPAAVSIRRSVAVLGFRNVTQRSDAAWLSTAFSEMITTELTADGSLRTVPGE